MSIWNKILIGFVFLAVLGFFYLAARTLRTHQVWRETAQGLEQKIEQVDEANRLLVEADEEGPDGEKGIRRIRADISRLLVGRGRVWYSCTLGTADGKTGEVAVTIVEPDPHGIAVKTVLYAFEEAFVADKGSYLGEFKVTGVDQDQKQVVLAPTIKWEPGSRELQRLTASQGPLTLYEIMPIDNRTTFAGMEEDRLKLLLPAESVREFQNDGRTITTDGVDELGLQGKLLEVDENGQIVYEDDNRQVVVMEVDEEGNVIFQDTSGQVVEPETVAEREVQEGSGKYLRPLYDYRMLFNDYYLQFAVLRDLIQAAIRDKQYVTTALADTQVQRQRRETEQTQLKTELAKYLLEKKAVTDHRDRLQRKVEGYRAEIEQVIAGNKATADQIARHQKMAAAKIDARTPRMAQSGPSTN